MKKTRAIAAIAIAGRAICGDDSRVKHAISSSDIKGVIEITTPDGWFTYFFPLINAEIILNQPYTDDNASITIAHGEIIPMNSNAYIHLGKGIKKVVFEGKIQDETLRTIISKGNKLSEFKCISQFDELAHRYLEKDNQQSFSGPIKEVINQFITLSGANITNNSEKSDNVNLQFNLWDLTLLEILERIIADKCYYYIDGAELIINDITDEIQFYIDKNSNIVSINSDTSQENAYCKCIVEGKDKTGEAVNIDTTSNKVIYIKDESILTQYDADTRASSELKTKNELTDAIEIILSDLIYPKFGKIKVSLPSIDKILDLKSIRYTINENGLFTTLYLGRSYDSLSNIFKKLKR